MTPFFFIFNVPLLIIEFHFSIVLLAGAQLQVSDEIFIQRGTIDELTERGRTTIFPSLSFYPFLPLSFPPSLSLPPFPSLPLLPLSFPPSLFFPPSLQFKMLKYNYAHSTHTPCFIVILP